MKKNKQAQSLSKLAAKARKKIPKEKRIEMARNAANARWGKKQ